MKVENGTRCAEADPKADGDLNKSPRKSGHRRCGQSHLDNQLSQRTGKDWPALVYRQNESNGREGESTKAKLSDINKTMYCWAASSNVREEELRTSIGTIDENGRYGKPCLHSDKTVCYTGLLHGNETRAKNPTRRPIGNGQTAEPIRGRIV